MCYRELCLGIRPGLPVMKQALWAAAPGFAGACLIDEIDLTEPTIPTFIRQSSQQWEQLQSWEHRKIPYGAGRHAVGVCHEQSSSEFGFVIMKASGSQEKHATRLLMGRGSADPAAPRSVGILAFNPGCDLGFTKWKTEMTLIPVQIPHNKCMS